MDRKKLFSAFKIIFSIGLGVYLTWYLFDKMTTEDIAVFKKTIRNANPWYIFLSLLLAFVSYLSRAYRWGLTLHPVGYYSTLKNQYHSLMIGYLVNMTIPRAGEFTRSLMLKRSDNIPIAGSFGTIVTERIIDMLILLTISFLSIFLNKAQAYTIISELKDGFFGTTQNTENTGNSGYLWLGIGLVLLITIIFLNKKIKSKILGFLKSLKEGLLSIFRVKKVGSYILHTFLIWGSYLIMFALPFWAIDATAEVPISGMFLAFIFGAVGISFTNGGMGAYPLLIGITTAYYIKASGGSDALAVGNALGMVIWATQTIFLILLGLISLVLMPRKYNTDEKS